jgi:hypothetical protein
MSDTDLVLKILGRIDGTPTPVDGQFIVHYDPTFDRAGAYRLDTSAEIDAAIGFSSVAEAWRYSRRPSPNKPFDGPGHVNRPITCYHIELLPRSR